VHDALHEEMPQIHALQMKTWTPKQHEAKRPQEAPAVSAQTSWPELVGQAGTDAVAAITAARPDLAQVVAVNEGDMMTMDVREDRVRVMVDGAGVVTQPPSVG
jgi:hypothetical protein